jgi:hypothetical protein
MQISTFRGLPKISTVFHSMALTFTPRQPDNLQIHKLAYRKNLANIGFLRTRFHFTIQIILMDLAKDIRKLNAAIRVELSVSISSHSIF